MLIVSIHRHHPDAVSRMAKIIIEGIFQASALSQIFGMTEKIYRQSFFLCKSQGLLKIFLMFRTAAVVHQNHTAKSHFDDPFHHCKKLFVGIEGGKYHGNGQRHSAHLPWIMIENGGSKPFSSASAFLFLSNQQ